MIAELLLLLLYIKQEKLDCSGYYVLRVISEIDWGRKTKSILLEIVKIKCCTLLALFWVL